MYKLNADITTDKGVLKAGTYKELDELLSPKEINTLLDGKYIQVFEEPISADEEKLQLEKKLSELTQEAQGLADQNGKLLKTIEQKNEKIKELENQLKELNAKKNTGKR